MSLLSIADTMMEDLVGGSVGASDIEAVELTPTEMSEAYVAVSGTMNEYKLSMYETIEEMKAVARMNEGLGTSLASGWESLKKIVIRVVKFIIGVFKKVTAFVSKLFGAGVAKWKSLEKECKAMIKKMEQHTGSSDKKQEIKLWDYKGDSSVGVSSDDVKAMSDKYEGLTPAIFDNFVGIIYKVIPQTGPNTFPDLPATIAETEKGVKETVYSGMGVDYLAYTLSYASAEDLKSADMSTVLEKINDAVKDAIEKKITDVDTVEKSISEIKAILIAEFSAIVGAKLDKEIKEFNKTKAALIKFEVKMNKASNKLLTEVTKFVDKAKDRFTTLNIRSNTITTRTTDEINAAKKQQKDKDTANSADVAAYNEKLIVILRETFMGAQKASSNGISILTADIKASMSFTSAYHLQVKKDLTLATKLFG